jgi:hypothetical protein
VYAFSVTVTWAALGAFAEYLMRQLNRISKRVDIWINEDKGKRREFRKLGDQIEEIVDIINMKSATEASIVLNGTTEVLKYKGLDLLSLENTIDDLKNFWKFRGIAVYGPGEWMAPNWFSYLIAQAALLRDKDANRAFIYDDDAITSWMHELGAIAKTLRLTLPKEHVGVFKRRKVEELLEKYDNNKTVQKSLEELYSSINSPRNWEKGVSVIQLMDIIYFESEDGKQKKCRWRNPAKNGEIELLPVDLTDKIKPLIDFFDEYLFKGNYIQSEI